MQIKEKTKNQLLIRNLKTL